MDGVRLACEVSLMVSKEARLMRGERYFPAQVSPFLEGRRGNRVLMGSEIGLETPAKTRPEIERRALHNPTNGNNYRE